MSDRRPMRWLRSSTLWLPLLCFLVSAAPLGAQLPPDARWRTLETPHFRVTFEEHLDSLARRAADRAERAYALLAEEFVEPPRGRVEMVLSDNVDYANGYATPFPTNRVVIYAHPPVDTPELAYYEDWLQLVVLHELVHTFHLDRSRGIWRRLRQLLGRNPLFFPNAYSPSWVTEGLATYLESRLTPGGRVRATLHDMALRTATLENAFFPIDRVTGSGTIWPGGAGRYIYGGRFIDYLARTRGPEKIPAFVERYSAKVVPFTVDREAKRGLGTSFTRAWAEWRGELQTRYAALADSLRAVGITEPEVLTQEGRIAAFPRYGPRGELAYSAASGVDQPALRLIGEDGAIRTLQGRTSAGSISWLPDGSEILYEQLEFSGPYRVFSDLYQVRLDGRDRRLTRAARLSEPDVDPTGRRVVAVSNAGASNRLVVHDLATGATTPITEPAMDLHWTLPRWSPGGDRIAVSRWAAGGRYDVVLLDSAGSVVRELTQDRAVDNAPTWSPDGRYVLFSSDRTGIPNLFAYDLRDDRLLQVTNVLTGAFQPTVSTDGRWIAFSYYRADGYHIARIPFEPGQWRPAPPVRPEAAGALAPHPYAAAAGGESRAYSPWPSVRPATWVPIVGDDAPELGVGVGVALFGEDVVERHLWDAGLTVFSDRARVEGMAGYRYRGFGNPVLDLAAEQDWEVALGADTRDATGKPLGSALLSRERQVGASLLWLARRWNSRASLGGGVELTDRDREWDDASAAGNRRIRQIPLDLAGVVQAGLSSARGYGISLGPQEGGSVTMRLEGHRYTAPFEGESEARGYLRLTTRGRSYHALPLPGFARHVLALRGDVGVEDGSRSPGFGVGGASGGGIGSALGLPIGAGVLGGGIGFPVRGYPAGTQLGNRAAVAGAEYRFPLRRIERGFRLLPVFLERAWGDLFVDAGTAWCEGPCKGFTGTPNSTPRPLVSVGAELSVDLEVGYLVPLPLRFGVALPAREPGAGTPQLYVRVGRAF